MKHPFEPQGLGTVPSENNNDPKLLSDIVDYVGEHYDVEDYVFFSEQVDYVLKYIRDNFTVTEKP